MYKYTHSDKLLSPMAIIGTHASTTSVQFLSSGTIPETIFFPFLPFPFVHLFKQHMGCFSIKITNTMDKAKN